MIKANELRIGNFVKADGYYPYADIDFVSKEFIGIGIDTYDIDAISPLEITEEWLKRFGFQIKIGDWMVATHIINTDFVLNNAIDSNWRFTPIWCIDYEPIKYVHQLQNLYYSLTGQELTLIK